MIALSNEKRPRKARARKFYIVGPNVRLGKGGWEMENLPALLMGPRILAPTPGQRGFPNVPEMPYLVFDKRTGRDPRDVEQFHDYWLVSDRIKTVLARLDPDGVAFVKCHSSCKHGGPAPTYWLCDVLRLLEAVDEEKSRLTIKGDSQGHKWYSFVGGASLVIREDVVASAHIFRLSFSLSNIVCDQELKDACKDAGLKGITFDDAADF
ncbi:DUF1629 domain-containing protein [Bradyrhizobium jicamae]|uniref:imm11 family protein n=1 Tax=Bradyrhizobium jicamae TaxID=280332 RepID=UPI001BA5D033|nr:DUF1629 domain-containing protein [Bradyrhizobium jicamae]MBR0756565.1 DUF1629 domain-containing protein [Bradyrhizobium jicamae]